MQKWEYKVVVNLPDNKGGKQKALNRHGAEGWELVCIDADDWYIFKRPLKFEKKLSELEWQMAKAIVPEYDV